MRRAPASLLLALLGLPLLAAVLACSMYLSSCSRRSNANLVTKRYELHGQIVRLDPQAHSAIISGQKIEGWMEAMTMEYPVKDQKEYQALHNGERIRATVVVQNLDFWIADIHREEAQEKMTVDQFLDAPH
jgi:protein SCO1/2